MKVLIIGSDGSVLKEDSEVRQRIIDYGNLVDELHIVVFSQSGKKRMDYRHGCECLSINGRVFIYPTNSLAKWIYVVDAIKTGNKILSDIQPSTSGFLISCQDPFECGFVGWLLKRRYAISLQLQIHTDFLSPYFRKESLLNWIRVLIARFLIPQADCLRIVSERIKENIVSTFGVPASKISQLPIFIDIKKIQQAPVRIDLRQKYSHFEFIILMASRLTKEKNISLALEAFADIANSYQKICLIIAGEGTEEKNIKVLVSKLKTITNNPHLDKQIMFEGWRDDLTSYYKTADLFLLTSNYEGYGRTVIEAMVCGCPVIMTDVGVAGDILKDRYNGLVVPVGNRERLRDAIIELINDKQLRAEIIEAARNTLNLFPEKKEYLSNYYQSWTNCL